MYYFLIDLRNEVCNKLIQFLLEHCRIDCHTIYMLIDNFDYPDELKNMVDDWTEYKRKELNKNGFENTYY